MPDQHAHVFLLLAKILNSSGQFSKALSVLEQSLLHHGPSTEVMFQAGMCCVRLGEYDVAVESFTRCLV